MTPFNMDMGQPGSERSRPPTPTPLPGARPKLHEYQVLQYGTCKCRCHVKGPPCECGVPEDWWVKPSTRKGKPGKTKLESRVRAFTKNRTKVGHRGINVISVMHQHGFHAERYVGE